MSLLATLKDAQKEAMKAKDKPRLTAIRAALAEVKQREIDNQTTLDDAGITSVLVKLVKQRKDSFTQYTDAGREDLAQIEAGEISVLESFLPQPLSEEEVLEMIDAAIADTGAAGMQDMGKVMGVIKAQAEGRADMGKISGLIKQRLSA
ncbi:GatB/YqeY domain-containing protein [Pseudoalteromonas luteoviolacea]|uniref:Aspartyl-tRNA amidotransferase subunit B n=1 Tax=Pseudoalteromonas luteoviolacea H33 TaxID=1365251 RepID=A0A161Y7C5_9GAMM|nr:MULTISPECIES: GatB/YqeY domain-containing protein [Pseudoalteromonas]KZN51495.1 aspartyl-tRNA amidotransferase subunit B [Pseudoalteromonas luteoviolacea H33]KZN71335.1 aspartyl-tRNA amidotransferase subunit B [Pseudoalteromonas luteoviolacea H33-S]MBQ4876691.1 GatB/YqeY domain-containing protein [Pseudoalteromonas luteoviolacea]MBQ4905520.1 GatB/YqeY domain-containing protein [Pseudoalteromonas luteoviolacea]MCF6438943.1 GatB/YqeY domain-containing protein [Pseudoalteromonas luteoviolacea]